MSSLKQFYPHLQNQAGSVALEIELESKKECWPEAEGWVLAKDGSLRYYGIELKSRQPVKEASLRKHLDALAAATKNYDWILPSPRTSVHVHVNALGLTPIQILTATCAYWLFEPAFFSMCDSTRKGNLFCLRLEDAYGMLRLIEDDVEETIISGTTPFAAFNGDNHRYASINLAALAKFGSLEFRALHGTLDIDLIERWAKMCMAVTYRSSRYATPQAMLDYTLEHGYKKVQEEVLGPEVSDILKVSDEVYDQQMERLVDFATLCDWAAYQAALDKCDPNKKKKNKREQLLEAAVEGMNRGVHAGAINVEAGQPVQWNPVPRANPAMVPVGLMDEVGDIE